MNNTKDTLTGSVITDVTSIAVSYVVVGGVGRAPTGIGALPAGAPEVFVCLSYQ